ncbi:MAG: endopolygalacturonase [Gemmatimonadetes bacterium]|nr:endopolygalacturonase [Gemmatimonadota bacterium]
MNLSISPEPTALSVHDTGARGDGITDDHGAIQRALDGLHHVVVIPSGFYILGDTLRIGSSKCLLVHPEAVLRFADGAGRDAGSFLLTNADHISGNDHIEVTGGIWDGNNEGNTRGEDGDPEAYTGVAINFVNIRHLRLTDMTVRNPDSFSIRLGEAQHFTVENIRLDHAVTRPNQDGVHVGGFCEKGYIRNLQAITPNTPNDDMVALNADDNVERALNLGMKRGPIRNIHVEGLAAESAYTFVRLLSETHRIENIRVRDLAGGCRCYTINMDNWAFPQGSGDIRNIDIKNVRISKVPDAPSFPLVDIRLRVQDLLIEDLERVEDCHAAPTLTIDNLTNNTIWLDDVTHENLELSSVDAGTIEGVIQPLFQQDGTQTAQVLIEMYDNSKLVLARGGIKRLSMNRKSTDG